MLILTQVYPPDPGAVGQQMADATAEMVRRGWRVVVLTSARGYNDPAIRYKPREVMNGVEIIRLPLSSFGKKGLLLRAAAAALFMVQCILRGLTMASLDALVVSTSPPMCIVAALVIQLFRWVPLKYWVMDINPDQLIALGKIAPDSLPARLMNRLNAMVMRDASRVIVLDRFMQRTMLSKLNVRGKMVVIPPWAHEEHIEPVPHEQNPFRHRHGLDGKFVFMYSGNHGIALPLETFLRAAVTFKDDPRLAFVFIGDGVRKKEVEATIRDHGMHNMLSLPYQPLADLKYSLSAADVHLVTIDNRMIGIIHPCKIYGAMAVARPILFLGPRPSHITDLLDAHAFGVQVEHGDVEGMKAVIRRLSSMDSGELTRMGATARQVMRENLSQRLLCNRVCDALE